MAFRGHSLWQILVTAGDPETTAPLTCDECFAILEYLAEEAAAGADPQALYSAARRHLAHCPDCREHHLRRLREVETRRAGGRG